MIRFIARSSGLAFILFVGAVSLYAQIDPTDAGSISPANRYERMTVKKMLSKQQAIQRQKDYDEMIKRSEEALSLSEKLEKSLLTHNEVTSKDADDLKSLQKLVSKILDEMGGDEDDSEKLETPSNFQDAVKYLRNATVELADELQKTTRFSISVAAIQTSNAVLRVIKFLRFQH